MSYRFGGVKFVSGTTGKLGRAWHRCMVGAWNFGWASWALHGAWCMASVHAASCMGGVPDGGWVNACLFTSH